MSEIENEKIKELLKAAAAEFNLAEIIILAVMLSARGAARRRPRRT